MKIYYFVAYYGPKKPYTNEVKTNKFKLYSPLYHGRYTYEKARYIAKYARRKNPDKKDYIHIDSFISYREA